MATGKISRLPREIREQLNRRLDGGEPGKRLVAWLNKLPAVQTLLAAEFGGASINEQNLTNWKQGGHRDWRMREEARVIVQSAASEASPPVVTTEQLSMVVGASYLVAAREEQRVPKPADQQFRLWRVILRDVVLLQRRENQGKRVALAGQWQAWRQEKKAKLAGIKVNQGETLEKNKMEGRREGDGERPSMTGGIP
jgi:hypothetical protein